MLHLQPNAYCHLPATEKPKFIVVIDTEEEFDWSADFSSNNTSVQAMRSIHLVQEIDAYHITMF